MNNRTKKVLIIFATVFLTIVSIFALIFLFWSPYPPKIKTVTANQAFWIWNGNSVVVFGTLESARFNGWTLPEGCDSSINELKCSWSFGEPIFSYYILGVRTDEKNVPYHFKVVRYGENGVSVNGMMVKN